MLEYHKNYYKNNAEKLREQTVENQRFEINRFCEKNTMVVNKWIEETISGTKNVTFAFGLSAEIERNLISQRTKEALARKRLEGKVLGRPKGSKSKTKKLTGRENEIKSLLEQKISKTVIAKLMKVHRLTVADFAKDLITPTKGGNP
jgi:DNA invertase Pin-like site-specific DNA recombinase